MEWTNLLYQIAEVCLIPLLGVLTAYIVKFIKAKNTEIQDKIESDNIDKYVNMVAETIASCVIATNQTYVEALKKQNAFTAEAQKEAFQMTYDAVMAILTEEAKYYLAQIYGDVSAYITTKIEAEVNMSK